MTEPEEEFADRVNDAVDRAQREQRGDDADTLARQQKAIDTAAETLPRGQYGPSADYGSDERT